MTGVLGRLPPSLRPRLCVTRHRSSPLVCSCFVYRVDGCVPPCCIRSRAALCFFCWVVGGVCVFCGLLAPLWVLLWVFLFLYPLVVVDVLAPASVVISK